MKKTNFKIFQVYFKYIAFPTMFISFLILKFLKIKANGWQKELDFSIMITDILLWLFAAIIFAGILYISNILIGDRSKKPMITSD